MKRKEKVYEALKLVNNGDGASAGEIASLLSLTRANVSNELNLMVREGQVLKNAEHRPVLYYLSHQYKTILDELVTYSPSLKNAVEQIKAAVLYPPHGMNMLILGETGTGKSMLAAMVHKYVVQKNIRQSDAPYITFNCADYANNAQLLLGQIFGVKKGAYTGADSDKVGLIELADGGILFLDEVHRLPPEGQEMLFTFLDKGIYRRLGETENERSARVLILSATTENPNTTLLQTFQRRIPMVIRIPSLIERTMEERLSLIKAFFNEESFRLKREIKVSVNSLRAFISYQCPNNIGQLKTDIQLSCAKAYADFMTNQKDGLTISSLDLLPHITDGFLKDTKHRQVWGRLIGVNTRYCIFNGKDAMAMVEDNESNINIYDFIDQKMMELQIKNINENKMNEILSEEITLYYKKNYFDPHEHTEIMRSLVDEKVLDCTQAIIRLAEEQLNCIINRSLRYALSLHIDSTINRIKANKKIINPDLNRIRIEFKQEFNLAIECLSIIDNYFDVSTPMEEAGFLANFFIINQSNSDMAPHHKQVKVLVAAHGVGVATGMAQTVCSLLDTGEVTGIDADLAKSPDVVLDEILDCLKSEPLPAGIILLVDMGSLVNFGEAIEKEMGVKTKVVPLVSTLHVLEAVRGVMFEQSLEEIYHNVLEVNDMANAYDAPDEVTEKEKYKIITICSSGAGTANAMKTHLTKDLKFSNNIIEICPMPFESETSVNNRLAKMEDIMFIVSAFPIHFQKPLFNLEDALTGHRTQEMQKIIDLYTSYEKMETSLNDILENIESHKAVETSKKFIKNLQSRTKTSLDISEIIGLVFHISCALDKLTIGELISSFNGKTEFIRENRVLYDAVRDEILIIEQEFSVSFPDEEICHLMNLLHQKIIL